MLMVESGWAASFPIYPSITGYPDLVLFREAAMEAYTEKRGIWGDPLTPTGYDFRMRVKLYGIKKKLVNDINSEVRRSMD